MKITNIARVLLWGAFAFILTTCVVAALSCTFFRPDPEDEPVLFARPVVLVTNNGLGPVTVYNGTTRIGTVFPRERRCLLILGTQETSTLALIVEGLTYFTPIFDPPLYDGGWALTVGTNPQFDLLSLEPAPRCSS